MAPPLLAPRPPFTRVERAALGVVMSLGGAWLLHQMATQSSGQGEYFAVERARGLLDLGGGEQLASEIHGPLYALISVPWRALGDALHTRLGLLWMRLPYLPLSLAAMALLARLGRVVGAPRAGVAAAAMFAGLQLPMELAVTAQNYLVEVVCGLWFTDRVAAFAAGERRPWLLSLSAAVALAAGYMNALVILPGLLLVTATLVRGRAWSTLWDCARDSVLFNLPVLPRALGAAWHYAALSVAHNQRHDVDLARAVHHDAIPLDGSFGGGELTAAAARLCVALFGALALVPPLGVLALPARPGPGAYALAVIGCFLVASTRVSLQLQNYGAVLPFVILWTVVGVEALLDRVLAATRLSPSARGAAASAAMAAFTLAALAAGQGTDATLSMPFLTLIDGDERPLREALASAPHNTPLLMYQRAHWDIPMHAVCRGTSGATATMNCVLGLFDDRAAGAWHVFRANGREVAHRPYRDGFSSQCSPEMVAAVDALARRPAWRRGWLVLRGELEPVAQPSCEPLGARFDRECSVVRRLRHGTVLRCPGVASP